MSTEITGKDRIRVESGGEEVEAFNHVNVETRHYVNSGNGHETFEPKVRRGMDGVEPPGYVTHRVAEYLWREWSIDVEDIGIGVIDVRDPEVELL